jgi:ferredoxin
MAQLSLLAVGSKWLSVFRCRACGNCRRKCSRRIRVDSRDTGPTRAASIVSPARRRHGERLQSCNGVVGIGRAARGTVAGTATVGHRYRLLEAACRWRLEHVDARHVVPRRRNSAGFVERWIRDRACRFGASTRQHRRASVDGLAHGSANSASPRLVGEAPRSGHRRLVGLVAQQET